MDILTISIALMVALYGLIAVAGGAAWLVEWRTTYGPSGATFGEDGASSGRRWRPRPAAMHRPIPSTATTAAATPSDVYVKLEASDLVLPQKAWLRPPEKQG